MRKRNIILIVLLVVGIFKIIDYLFFPQIRLVKGKTYYINYKETYKEPGYKIYLRGKRLHSYATRVGMVDSEKIGDYKISYQIGESIFKKKVTRTVKVRDLEEPEIKLASYDDIIFCRKLDNVDGSKNIFTSLSSRRKEKLSFFDTGYLDIIKNNNYQVVDNYDGDITNQLKVIKTDNYYQYVVEDSSHNKKVIIRKIKYQDKEKPEITLNGEDYLTVYLNEDYQEPGYSVSDNCDKKIKEKVKIKSSINTKKPGLYKIEYQVRDSSKNKDSKVRYVSVSKPLQKGAIYLTFDDGPRLETTSAILDILKEEGVKATFFVTNKGPDSLIQREYAEGHTIALHTASHDYSYLYSSVENYFKDLESVGNRVKRLTGMDTKIIRFPGGSSNTVSRKYKEGIMSILTKEVLKRGYKYFDWNINSGDAGVTTNPLEEVSLVTSKLSKEKENVVLMHDIKTHTKEALRDIIRYGKENGYTFLPLTMDDDILTQKVNN